MTDFMPVENDLERSAALLEASGDYRILRRLRPESLFLSTPPSGDIGLAVCLDTETTGRDLGKDQLIELGMVSFAYDRGTGQFLGALALYDEMEDPGLPIPPEATRINNITDSMVAGKRIDDAAVRAFVEEADFVVAHNAGFDRHFCERRFPVFKDKAWACSKSQVGWENAGIASTKLEYIATRMGFYYEAHRAEADCLALLQALRLKHPGFEGRSAFEQLLANYWLEDRRIWAVNSPFETKDLLKARGYRWSDGSRPDSEKAWWIEVPLAGLEDELAWLKSCVYGGRSFSVPIDKVDAYSRFTERRVRLERAYVGPVRPTY